MSIPRTGAPAARHGHRLFVQRLADLPIWTLRTTTGRSLNSVLVAGPDGQLLINTGTSHQHGNEIRTQIAKLTGQPATTIVYPHHPSANCHGTSAVIDEHDTECGNVVVLAAGHRDGHRHPGPAPNLLVDRECVLELSGVVVRLLPARTETMSSLNIYLPKYRVGMIADEPCLWARDIGPRAQPRGSTPFAHAVGWFLRFPVEHLLGSHILPLSGPEVHLVLRTYLDRPPGRP
jgi:hypothetical protein